MNRTRATHVVPALCIVAIVVACALPSVADYDLNSATGIWLFEEGEGDIAKDSSPNGNDGVLWRGPEWVDGRFGGGLYFNGEAFVWMKDVIGIPEQQAPRTLMCYFKWEAVDWEEAYMLVALGPNTGRGNVTLGMWVGEGGRVQGGKLGPGVYTHDDVQYFEWEGDTDWHHIATVFPDGATESNEFLFYLDGVHQPETFMDDDVNIILSAGGVLTVGCSEVIKDFWKGIIDDVALFPFAMSEEDIRSAAKRGVVKGQTLDVSPRGKLAMSWGAIKERE